MVLFLFCCGIFWFDTLECHRYTVHVQPKHITGCVVGFKSGTLGLLIKFSDLYHLY